MSRRIILGSQLVEIKGDNITIPLPTLKSAIFQSVGNQSIPNTTSTPLNFVTLIGDSDLTGGYDPITDTFTATANTAGFYIITTQARWQLNGVGNRQLTVRVNAITCCAQFIANAGAGDDVINSQTVMVRIAPGDVIDWRVFQNSGGSLDVVGLTNTTLVIVGL